MGSSKNQLISFTFVQIIFICISLTAMILAIITNNKAAKSKLILKDIYENHNSEPKFDFQLGGDPNQSLSNAMFPGTYAGCYCAVSFDRLKVGYCSRKKYSFACQNIAPVPARKLSIWRNSYLSYSLINNISKKNFDTNQILDYYYLLQNGYVKPECNLGEVSCGIIDSLKNKLCISDTIDKCPLNFAKILPNDQSPNVNSKSINLDKTTIFYTNTNVNDNIIVDLKTVEAENVCADSSEFHGLTLGYELEINVPKRTPVCSKMILKDKSEIIYNNNYVLVDHNNKLDVYNENQLTNVLSSLPQYQVQNLANYSFWIYYRNFIGWKSECLNSYDTHPKTIGDLGKESDDNITNTKPTMIIGIIIFIFSFVSVCCVIRFSCDDDKGCDVGIVWGCILVVQGSLSLACGILMIKVDLVKISPLIFDCTDLLTAAILKLAKDNNEVVNKYANNLVGLYFFLLALLILGCIIICKCIYKGDDSTSTITVVENRIADVHTYDPHSNNNAIKIVNPVTPNPYQQQGIELVDVKLDPHGGINEWNNQGTNNDFNNEHHPGQNYNFNNNQGGIILNHNNNQQDHYNNLNNHNEHNNFNSHNHHQNQIIPGNVTNDHQTQPQQNNNWTPQNAQINNNFNHQHNHHPNEHLNNNTDNHFINQNIQVNNVENNTNNNDFNNNFE